MGLIPTTSLPPAKNSGQRPGKSHPNSERLEENGKALQEIVNKLVRQRVICDNICRESMEHPRNIHVANTEEEWTIAGKELVHPIGGTTWKGLYGDEVNSTK